MDVVRVLKRWWDPVGVNLYWAQSETTALETEEMEDTYIGGIGY